MNLNNLSIKELKYKLQTKGVKPDLIEDYFYNNSDKLANYEDTINAINRFPNCTFIPFETGGHLMTGHSEEIKKAVSEFIVNTQ